jgi:hypothetical protein
MIMASPDCELMPVQEHIVNGQLRWCQRGWQVDAMAGKLCRWTGGSCVLASDMYVLLLACHLALSPISQRQGRYPQSTPLTTA